MALWGGGLVFGLLHIHNQYPHFCTYIWKHRISSDFSDFKMRYGWFDPDLHSLSYQCLPLSDIQNRSLKRGQNGALRHPVLTYHTTGWIRPAPWSEYIGFINAFDACPVLARFISSRFVYFKIISVSSTCRIKHFSFLSWEVKRIFLFEVKNTLSK